MYVHPTLIHISLIYLPYLRYLVVSLSVLMIATQKWLLLRSLRVRPSAHVSKEKKKGRK